MLKKSQRVPSSRFFGTMRLLKILIFCFFCKFFQVSLQFFEFLQQNGCLKNLKVPPFTILGIVRFFKLNNFCLKIRFSQDQHAISDFCFFFKGRCFFYATFFLICFHRSLLNFYLKRNVLRA